jgi:hypothetical protein
MFTLLAIAGPFALILFAYVGVYIARCYAIVLTESSGGLDRVRWPRGVRPHDRIQDWVADGWLVLAVFTALVSLTAILATPLALVASEPWQPTAVLGLALAFVWFAFPIAICSAHHPALIAALPRRIGPMILVWAMTAPLAALAGFGVGLTLMGYAAGLYLVAIVGPPAILVHARAWGRFVWLALNERPKRRRKRPVSDYAPEPDTAIRAAKPAAAPTVVDEGGYAVESTDWKPEPGNLAEHYEIQRERERWKRMQAGEEIADPLGRRKPPKSWTAFSPSKIFGILLDAETAAAGVCMGVGLAALCGVVLAITG